MANVLVVPRTQEKAHMPVEVVKNSAAEPKGVTAVAKDASEASNLLLSNFLEVAPAESVIVRSRRARRAARCAT